MNLSLIVVIQQYQLHKRQFSATKAFTVLHSLACDSFRTDAACRQTELDAAQHGTARMCNMQSWHVESIPDVH